MTGMIGTPRYMAPELIGSNFARYSYPIDVYSFSILFWQIISDCTPFADCKSSAGLYEKVIKGKRPPLTRIRHEKIKKLIEEGWSLNPSDRPSFRNIRQRLDDVVNYGISNEKKKSKSLPNLKQLWGSAK